ncbi:MAG: hypothetical protein KDE53_30100 [Caldilineaceae bacterium]|nr:hypothetical protein [Caldilineaceae bacterium]MCB0186916.1 hypothetical protein [Caldilineaceae bacterium]
MPCDSKTYQIRVKGHLDQRWLAWFDDLNLTLEEDGTTVITASQVDQAKLHGILARLRDTGVILLSVQSFHPD